MQDVEVQQKFIELRSQGVPFARIAEQLGVAKSTLINWSHKHQFLIQNLRAIEWEAFADRLLASRQDRLQALSSQLTRLETELAKRDPTSLSTYHLHLLIETLHRRLRRETGPMTFTTSVQEDDHDCQEKLQDWNP